MSAFSSESGKGNFLKIFLNGFLGRGVEKTQDLLKREAKAADFVRCETQKE